MQRLEYRRVVEAVSSLCIKAAYQLPEDVTAALERACHSETDARARNLISLLLENARVAAADQYPLCQDTGVTIIFADMGADFFLTAPQDRPSATIIDAINEGVALGYEQGYLRKSIVDDPLNERKNTGTNTPAIIYMNLVPGDRLRLRLMLKGGGCENRSQVKMLKPADGEEGVKDFIVDVVRQAGADACPPFVVGVGIGGDFEMSAILAKKALLRSMDSGHENPYYAQIERELLNRINDLGIGPQGMGGRTTALGVLIETYPCHIASLPVAVNIECHSHRHAEITI
jgi:fumarate hydratase subunit alpha